MASRKDLCQDSALLVVAGRPDQLNIDPRSERVASTWSRPTRCVMTGRLESLIAWDSRPVRGLKRGKTMMISKEHKRESKWDPNETIYGAPPRRTRPPLPKIASHISMILTL